MRHPSPRLPALPESPRVSCILTAYNYAEYLPAAIDSALAQDYPADRLELIVVDDGSTDDTPAVLARYAGRIRAIRRPNGGLNAATTTGMQAATGDLLTFLDADDLWRPDRIRLLVDALRAAPAAAIAYGDMEIVDSDGVTTAPSFRAAMGLQAPSGRVFHHLFAYNFISAGSMMVRADLAAGYVPIPPFAAHQDWWIASQVTREHEVVAIPEAVNLYRHHDANMNLGVDGDRLTRLFETEIPFRRWLLQTADPGLVGPAALAAGVATLTMMIDRVVGDRGLDGAAAELEIGPQDRAGAARAMQAASAALDDGCLAEALLGLVVAVGHDPFCEQSRDLVAPLAAIVEQAAAELAVARA